MEISTTLTNEPVGDARLAEILSNPGFGSHFARIDAAVGTSVSKVASRVTRPSA